MAERMEFVEVGDNKYPVIKTGRAHAEQVLALTKWISKHGSKAIDNLRDSGQTLAGDSGLLLIGKLVEGLTVDALLDLFAVVTGCSQEEAEVYFDVAILVDVAIEIYEHQPAIRRLLERFFSAPSSETADLGASSTTSE